MTLTVTEFDRLLATITHDLTMWERLNLYWYCRSAGSFVQAEAELRESGVDRFANILAAIA